MLIYSRLSVLVLTGGDQIVECGVFRYFVLDERSDLVLFEEALKLRSVFFLVDLSIEGDLVRHGSYQLRGRKGFLDECLLDRGTSSLVS
jgi:hypothetical protein